MEECLSSIFQQDLDAFELVVGDDGSTDRSWEILQSVTDPRIKLLPRKGNLGLFANLNRIAAATSGELIQIFCQDDRMLTSCLGQMSAFMQTHPECAMAYCKSEPIDESGRVTPHHHSIDLPDVLPSMLAIQHFFYHGCIPGNLSTVMMRKSAFDHSGGFAATLKVSGDYDLWARLAVLAPVGVVHQQLVQLRTHSKRLSRLPTSGVQFIRENRAIRQRLFPLLPKGVKGKAKVFESSRLHVMELHYGFWCLIKGRFLDLAVILKGLGLKSSLLAFYYWASTANNRIYRPQAPWVLPSESPTVSEPSSSKISSVGR